MASASADNDRSHVTRSDSDQPVLLPDSEYDLINGGSVNDINHHLPDASPTGGPAEVGTTNTLEQVADKSISDEDLSLSFVVLSKEDGEEAERAIDVETGDRADNNDGETTADRDNRNQIDRNVDERTDEDDIEPSNKSNSVHVDTKDDLFSLVNVDSMDKERGDIDEQMKNINERSVDAIETDLGQNPTRADVTEDGPEDVEDSPSEALQWVDLSQSLSELPAEDNNEPDKTKTDVTQAASLHGTDVLDNHEDLRHPMHTEDELQNIESKMTHESFRSDKTSISDIGSFDEMKYAASVDVLNQKSDITNEDLEETSGDLQKMEAHDDQDDSVPLDEDRDSSFVRVSSPSTHEKGEGERPTSPAITELHTVNIKPDEHDPVTEQAVPLELHDDINDRQVKMAWVDTDNEAETSFIEEYRKPLQVSTGEQHQLNEIETEVPHADEESVAAGKDTAEQTSLTMADKQIDDLQTELEPTFIIKDATKDTEVATRTANESVVMDRKSPSNIIDDMELESEESWSAIDEGPAQVLPKRTEQSEEMERGQLLDVTRSEEVLVREKPVPKPRNTHGYDMKDSDLQASRGDIDTSQSFKVTGRSKDPSQALAADHEHQGAVLNADQTVRTKALARLRQAQTYDIEGEEREDTTTIRRQKSQERFEYFWKADDIYSQWFPAGFVIDGRRFSSAEQYMMFKKAELFDDAKMMDKIMKTTDPQKIKRYGRLVKNFNERLWRDCSLYYVREGVEAKFSQNAEMRMKLFDTWPRILVEASPMDPIWGIGCSRDDPAAHQETTWRGLNLLGYVITEVRDDLMCRTGRLKQEHKQVTLEQLKAVFEYGELPPINTNIHV